MTAKAAIVLLALLLLAGMIGRRFAPPVAKRKEPAIESARKCPACGAYVVNGAACARADCPRA